MWRSCTFERACGSAPTRQLSGATRRCAHGSRYCSRAWCGAAPSRLHCTSCLKWESSRPATSCLAHARPVSHARMPSYPLQVIIGISQSLVPVPSLFIASLAVPPGWQCAAALMAVSAWGLVPSLFIASLVVPPGWRCAAALMAGSAQLACQAQGRMCAPSRPELPCTVQHSGQAENRSCVSCQHAQWPCPPALLAAPDNVLLCHAPLPQCMSPVAMAVIAARYGPGIYEPSADVSLPAAGPFSWAVLLAALVQRRQLQLLLGWAARSLPAVLYSCWQLQLHRRPTTRGTAPKAAAEGKPAADEKAMPAEEAMPSAASASNKHAAGRRQGAPSSSAASSSFPWTAVAETAVDAQKLRAAKGCSSHCVPGCAAGSSCPAAAATRAPSPAAPAPVPRAAAAAAAPAPAAQRSARFKLVNLYPRAAALKPGAVGWRALGACPGLRVRLAALAVKHGQVLAPVPDDRPPGQPQPSQGWLRCLQL